MPDVEWSPGLQHVVREDHGAVRQQAQLLHQFQVRVEARTLLVHKDHAERSRSIGVEQVRDNIITIACPNVHIVGHASVFHHVAHDRHVDGVNLKADHTASMWTHSPCEVHGRVPNVGPDLEHQLWACQLCNLVDDRCLLPGSDFEPQGAGLRKLLDRGHTLIHVALRCHAHHCLQCHELPRVGMWALILSCGSDGVQATLDR
mmetsp:Transcript_93109/g.272478  ORF Transcript_93109/g.272478 Transcript_93109/m.272478 type:complete len:203 (-) Transcript_93109:46-654(-)